MASSKRSRASLRLVACDRESCTVTLIPVGKCRSVTAVETLFTCCPPGPLDLANVSSRLASRIPRRRIRSLIAPSGIAASLSTPQFNLPMAGLEPARAFYGPTDFKSVASAISPHRLRNFATIQGSYLFSIVLPCSVASTQRKP